MDGSKLTSERRHCIGSHVTGSFPFSENQAEISTVTIFIFFLDTVVCQD